MAADARLMTRLESARSFSKGLRAGSASAATTLHRLLRIVFDHGLKQIERLDDFSHNFAA